MGEWDFLQSAIPVFFSERPGVHRCENVQNSKHSVQQMLHILLSAIIPCLQLNHMDGPDVS